ncbi:hypothetical protein LEN26_005628 [Aphanomyces euteiches]|nr:hypothetical protein AeMF1_016725 [Aphanomyces euteiches]KAH9137680.1 hypothetical protein LEN26_005628 [Aphanomyces euteiches]KAH9197920.1 hypothetical protein AeNC1_000101 [Aphanomyces euteiches]
MWLYQAAKQVQEKVQERATSIVAQVQDEASSLLKTMSQMQSNPVDEIIFEELDDYKDFQEVFDLDMKTDDVAAILQKDEFISDLHTAMVPEQLSYKEFWTRYYFRQFMQLRREEEEAKREEERRQKLEQERQLREQRRLEAEAREAEEAQERAEQLARENDLQMWKDQVASLQEVIASLEKAESTNHQLLVEEYETKMAQMTLQIDDAKATGYEEGIAESEQIIKSMRESIQQEQKEMEAYIFSLVRPGATMPSPPASVSADLAKAIWSLHSAASQEIAPSAADGASFNEVTPDVTALKEELESLRAENQALKTTSERLQETVKEVDVWKARALKMKKMKDEADAAAKHQEEQVKQEIAEAMQQGIAYGKAELAGEIAALQAQVTRQAEEISRLKNQPASAPLEAAPVPPTEATVAANPGEPGAETRGDDWGEWD